MAITLVGTLPVGALNIGLTGAIPGFLSLVADLQGQILKLGINIAQQLAFKATLPSITLPGVTVGLEAQLLTLPQFLNPASWVTFSTDASTQLLVDLGLVTISVELVGTIVAAIEAGIDVPGLATWAYSGRAAGFGASMAAATPGGWGSVPANRNVNAVMIATEDVSSWRTFGLTWNIGSSGLQLADPRRQALRFLGFLGGASVNLGVAAVLADLKLYLDTLKGAQANLLAQLQVTLGLNIPDIAAFTATIELILDDPTRFIPDLLANLLVIPDFTAEIEKITLRLQALVDFLAELNVTLSAGGLTLWSYAGPAGLLGAELAAATANGLPGGAGPNAPAYGSIVACADPSAWSSFGLVFKTS